MRFVSPKSRPKKPILVTRFLCQTPETTNPLYASPFPSYSVRVRSPLPRSQATSSSMETTPNPSSSLNPPSAMTSLLAISSSQIHSIPPTTPPISPTTCVAPGLMASIGLRAYSPTPTAHTPATRVPSPLARLAPNVRVPSSVLVLMLSQSTHGRPSINPAHVPRATCAAASKMAAKPGSANMALSVRSVPSPTTAPRTLAHDQFIHAPLFHSQHLQA